MVFFATIVPLLLPLRVISGEYVYKKKERPDFGLF